ncbi:MAG: Ig-like domain-containing protein [Bacteroidales bacterium]|nr:Ig-like domain-containing protein [Bacteroidales bacterium]
MAEIPTGNLNTVRGCRFYENADDGIDLWNNEGVVVIENCWSWRNGYREDGVTPGGDGAGFKLGKTVTADYSLFKRILTNNISVSNRIFGLTQNSATCKMFICNNIFYDNKHMGIYFSASWGDAAHMIRNNIAYKNGTDAAIGINLPVLDHNSWQPEVTVTNDDFISIDPTQLVRPRKSDGSLPNITFMHIAPGSDLIDAGIDVGIPYWGTAPEIGAFEIETGIFHHNLLPVVSISFPTKGTSFSPPATLTVSVEANDPDGSITKVELFNGVEKLGEMTSAPYSFTLKDLPAGSYLLKAVATDNLKATAASSQLEFMVYRPYRGQRLF